MSGLSYGICAEDRPEVSLSAALARAEAAGVRLLDGKHPCTTFTSKIPPHDLLRDVGELHGRPGDRDLRAYARCDATRDDVTVLLLVAARVARNPKWGDVLWRATTSAKHGPHLRTWVARRLADYGGDLALVAGIPDHLGIAHLAPATNR